MNAKKMDFGCRSHLPRRDGFDTGNDTLWRFVRYLIFLLVLSLAHFALAAENVTLAWNPSPDPVVIGYRIYYGGASGRYTNEIDVGPATNVTVSGLVDGATYYFAATTYTITGVESPFSGELTFLAPYRVMLYTRVTKVNGLPASLFIGATTTPPGVWAVQSSPDLKTWTTIRRGTNLAINVQVPLPGPPRLFFRLAGQ